jgi:hypothetical protein
MTTFGTVFYEYYLSQEYSFSAWRSLWQKIQFERVIGLFVAGHFHFLISNAIKLGCQG